MRERETGRKAGGLLCDDMGYVMVDENVQNINSKFSSNSLGKTIQTVVRIIDGPPSKEDRKKGWARTTLRVLFSPLW